MQNAQVARRNVKNGIGGSFLAKRHPGKRHPGERYHVIPS